jgi:ABC-type Fe3+-hydroxamate transport system substrate-binding protein
MMKKISLTLALCLTLTACAAKDKRADQKDAPASSSSGSTPAASQPATASDMGGEPVEHPEPTAAQTAALAGGQTASWDQQGITWTLPANWKKQNVETKMLTYSAGDGAVLIVSISTMDESFPTDISLKATYDGTKTRKKNGEVDELRYLEIDGVKGVQFRESPEKPDDFKRLQWLAYRKFAGQTQLVNLMLSTSNKNFAKHQDEFYAILYSTKLVH